MVLHHGHDPVFLDFFPRCLSFFVCFALGARVYGILDAGLTAHKINVGEYGFDGPSPLFSIPAILYLFFITALIIIAIYPRLIQ